MSGSLITRRRPSLGNDCEANQRAKLFDRVYGAGRQPSGGCGDNLSIDSSTWMSGRASAKKSVRAIFAELGENEFRRRERDALESCRGMKKTVIALGGGAYIADENRAIIGQTGEAVWLDCPLEVSLYRIECDGSRPLLASKSEMEALLDRRRPFMHFAESRRRLHRRLFCRRGRA